jgi:hypothetical protein
MIVPMSDEIPVPDGTTVTRDEGFAAWLAMNEYLVEEDFLVFDIDAMPDDPYTEDGLRVVEAAALERFPDVDSALAPENREAFDKFVRYLGTAFVQGLGGQWTNKPLTDDGRAFIGVRFPWVETPLNIPTMITAAITRRSGDEWAFVWRRQQKRRDAAS